MSEIIATWGEGMRNLNARWEKNRWQRLDLPVSRILMMQVAVQLVSFGFRFLRICPCFLFSFFETRFFEEEKDRLNSF